MVKDVNDLFNFVVVKTGDEPAVVGNAQTDNEARKIAEDHAGRDHDHSFAVYQRVGSCRSETEVKWKGGA